MTEEQAVETKVPPQLKNDLKNQLKAKFTLGMRTNFTK
jgi:hypothetical protein